ncbi:MAG: hypothetical protein GY820_30100 [Gammaproteobacteria bacterium]|nr:hypothetical protein [Gammaproteobacteria bacterium]
MQLIGALAPRFTLSRHPDVPRAATVAPEQLDIRRRKARGVLRMENS